jgi:hypothetical protein
MKATKPFIEFLIVATVIVPPPSRIHRYSPCYLLMGRHIDSDI